MQTCYWVYWLVLFLSYPHIPWHRYSSYNLIIFLLSYPDFYVCFTLHDGHLETTENVESMKHYSLTCSMSLRDICCPVTTQYREWIHFHSSSFFLEKTVKSPCFLFISWSLSLNAFDGTTSWITGIWKEVDGTSIKMYVFR